MRRSVRLYALGLLGGITAIFFFVVQDLSGPLSGPGDVEIWEDAGYYFSENQRATGRRRVWLDTRCR